MAKIHIRNTFKSIFSRKYVIPVPAVLAKRHIDAWLAFAFFADFLTILAAIGIPAYVCQSLWKMGRPVHEMPRDAIYALLASLCFLIFGAWGGIYSFRVLNAERKKRELASRSAEAKGVYPQP